MNAGAGSPRKPNPHQRPRDEMDEDQPTIVINSGDVSTGKIPGYSVHAKGGGLERTEEMGGITEQIPVEEVQDVVVLLDENPASVEETTSMSTSGAAALAAADADLAGVGQLPDLGSVEDITSLIQDTAGGEMHAPSAQSPGGEAGEEPPVATYARRTSWRWAAAALVLIAAGVGTWFGAGYFQDDSARPKGTSTTIAKANPPPKTGKEQGVASTDKPSLEAVAYRTWVDRALRASLGEPSARH